MWSASLEIEDLNKCVNYKVNYTFYQTVTYYHLFNSLHRILLDLNYDRREALVDSSQIEFSFCFLGHYNKINDWKNHIFSNEVIKIVIHKRKPMYYLMEAKTNIILEKSENLNNLYKYYQDYL